MLTKTPLSGSQIQLHVELSYIKPSTWRRLDVPADATLDTLHDVLQVAFGWTNSHLHDFTVGDVRFGMPDVEDELLSVDERAAPLGALVNEGSTFVYRYDFGDDWEHVVTVERVVEPEHGPLRLACLGGARACPPEDCGGPFGYENLLRVLRDPADEEHTTMRRWVGKAFDPERFDIEKVNKKLGVIAKRLARRLRTPHR